MLKIPKFVPKWLPNWSGGIREIDPLGALVGHLGPEVPHKGPKGSKMTQNAQKTIKNESYFTKMLKLGS